MSENATVEEILALDDSHNETVKVPEWGDKTILVRSMTAVERSEIERDWAGGKASQDPGGFRAAVLERCLKKSDGSPWATPEQIEALMGKRGRAVERLFIAACKVGGFTQKDIEEIEGN